MATLVENAVRIKETFDDIYDAIVEQGVTPSGAVDTYADAIDEIPGGEIIIPNPLTVSTSNCVMRSGYINDYTKTDLYMTNGYNIANTYINNTYFTLSSSTYYCQKKGLYAVMLKVRTREKGNIHSGDDDNWAYIDIYKNSERIIRHKDSIQNTGYHDFYSSMYVMRSDQNDTIKFYVGGVQYVQYGISMYFIGDDE